MIRIFLPPEELRSDNVVITGDNARHLSVVLRVKPGDRITVFDGQGYKYDCSILSSHKREVIARITGKELYSVEPPLSITLAQGLPKSDKMDLIIQKSTELGASKIIPLYTERSQVRHTGKVKRWHKIALSASQQSGRDRAVQIVEPVSYRDFLTDNILDDYQLKIVFSESTDKRNLKKLLNEYKDAEKILILIGPEGGFSEEEISFALNRDFLDVSLGPRILRTETAALTALSIIQYALGDMG